MVLMIRITLIKYLTINMGLEKKLKFIQKLNKFLLSPYYIPSTVVKQKRKKETRKLHNSQETVRWH